MRILVIDDEPSMRDIARFALEPAGHQVTTAATAEEGIRLANEIRPDVVLLDTVLPGVQGFEALSMISAGEDTGNIPVIAFSAKDSAAEIQAALDAGATGYITKPFQPSELALKVAEILARHARAPEAGPPEAPRTPLAGLIPGFEERLKRYGVNPGEVDAEIRDSFREQVAASAGIIRDALASGDMETVRRRAHSLKGMGATVGEPEVSVIADEMLNAAHENDAERCTALNNALEERGGSCE